MVAVPVRTVGAGFAFDAAMPRFKVPIAEAAVPVISDYDLTPDGRFLVGTGTPDTRTPPATIIFNWTEALKTMASERRSVADEPDVPEGIDEPALAVRSPGHGVHRCLVTASRCTGRECTRNEGVRIITEEFDAYRRHAELLRGLPAVVRWLAHKERRALNVQADD